MGLVGLVGLVGWLAVGEKLGTELIPILSLLALFTLLSLEYRLHYWSTGWRLLPLESGYGLPHMRDTS